MSTFVHKSVLADLLTPVSAFLKVSNGSDRAFLLESVEGGEKVGRFSFIGIDPEESFRGSFADFRSRSKRYESLQIFDTALKGTNRCSFWEPL